MRRSVLFTALALFALVPAACSSDDSSSTQTVASAQLPQGQFLVGMSVAPLGNFVLPYHVNINADVVEISGVGSDSSVSDVLASATGVTVSEAGVFDVDFGSFIMPGAYTPTGSDVEVNVQLAGTVSDEGTFCGDVTGEVVTLSLDLDGSIFGAVPWTGSGDDAPGSCEGVAQDTPRIDTCPTLVAGSNTFDSAGKSRVAEIVLPSSYDAGQSYPLVFVYHGFGGEASDMLDGGGFRARSDLDDVILIAPSASATEGNSPAFDSIGSAGSNPDIVHFDDLLKCAKESFSVDNSRVYVTGMSNGGLMTGALLATRGDQLAAVAPFSGGVITDWDTDAMPPVLAIHGGPTDTAFDQDFDKLAGDMAADLESRGQFAVLCNHNLGHTYEIDMLPWAMEFLLAHELGGSPAYSSGLSASFPDYCAVQ